MTSLETRTLQLETYTSFDEARAIAAEWDALDASLYMTYDWCRVWWRHYGEGRELRLIAVREGDELAGVLPFCIERIALARVAKLAGCDHTIAFADPPVDPAVAPDALARAVRLLIEADRCDVVHLGPISSAAPQIESIRRSAADTSAVARVVRDREAGAHTVFRMPDGFDAYLAGLSKNSRSNYRRNVNKLGKAFDFQVDIVRDGPELERELEAFVEMHQAQWRAVGKLGHFGDWPGSLEFTRDLVATLARRDGVRLIRLVADGEVVSYYFCFERDGTYYWRLPARLTGEEWDQFALGRVGLLKMIEVAAAEGATAIEAGTGRYEYKEKLNADTLPLCSIVLCRRSLASRLRARAALLLGDALDLAYYRVWFSRVAPGLGIPLRPLWRSWIRTRF